MGEMKLRGEAALFAALVRNQLRAKVPLHPQAVKRAGVQYAIISRISTRCNLYATSDPEMFREIR